MRHQRTPSGLIGRWWPRRNFMSKTIKFFLLVVFCGTIILNVLFLAETTKRNHDTMDNGGRHPRNLRQHVCFGIFSHTVWVLHTKSSFQSSSQKAFKILPKSFFFSPDTRYVYRCCHQWRCNDGLFFVLKATVFNIFLCFLFKLG